MFVSALLLSLLFTLTVGAGDNIDVEQCSVLSECLQCMSKNSREMERCQQLYFLITLSDNHPGELDLYCSGSCPIVLATANHYCGSGTSSLFDVCSFYEIEPTGREDIGDSSCIGGCDYCIHENSQDVRKCLQLQLLLQATNNSEYRSTFCTGNCPLTLSTSNWYCGSGFVAPFAECVVNNNGRYCVEISEVINDDPDVQSCTSQSACNEDCRRAINKYGCCLRNRGFIFSSTCGVNECDVETGGSPAHIATPLIFFVMLIVGMVSQ